VPLTAPGDFRIGTHSRRREVFVSYLPCLSLVPSPLPPLHLSFILDEPHYIVYPTLPFQPTTRPHIPYLYIPLPRFSFSLYPHLFLSPFFVSIHLSLPTPYLPCTHHRLLLCVFHQQVLNKHFNRVHYSSLSCVCSVPLLWLPHFYPLPNPEAPPNPIRPRYAPAVPLLAKSTMALSPPPPEGLRTTLSSIAHPRA